MIRLSGTCWLHYALSGGPLQSTTVTIFVSVAALLLIRIIIVCRNDSIVKRKSTGKERDSERDCVGKERVCACMLITQL